jgi:hypothetical protein
MEENEITGMDERTLLFSRAIGISLILVGIYGMYYAYKIYKGK